jgi:hypothetical protein
MIIINSYVVAAVAYIYVEDAYACNTYCILFPIVLLYVDDTDTLQCVHSGAGAL